MSETFSFLMFPGLHSFKVLYFGGFCSLCNSENMFLLSLYFLICLYVTCENKMYFCISRNVTNGVKLNSRYLLYLFRY